MHTLLGFKELTCLFFLLVCHSSIADRYVVIKFEMPDSGQFITYLFDSQGNRCEQVRNHLYKRYSNLCADCEVGQNACIADLPFEYSGVFEKKTLSNPYMILEGIITKAVVYEGFGSNTFSSLCTMQKQSGEKTICITGKPQ